ncbi:hypothetical protein F9C07_2224026 [Aspergillus flavus]|uniref:Indole-diterpene biosynthesis protein PaxU n=1 Tax=Aspergillus flavus (strain ATCC 200026 / FGSC A1120 / IAM 13836 / NRRL 3357 / JCM 12722 / SRRC 167) TaxID=332952 RepID=A0A7U2N3H1_ASPFN|nr:hypothetical protein F9C07_2224026 [Aspergillus flavus]
MTSQQPPFAAQRGFTAITDRVYIHHVCDESPSDTSLKHVSKYSDGYHEIFPHAKIVIVLSRTIQAVTQRHESRIEAMMPVIDIVFPTRCTFRETSVLLLRVMGIRIYQSIQSESESYSTQCRIAGAILLAATLVAYQCRQGIDRKFPISMLVCDSTPGAVGIFSSRSLPTWLPFITVTQVQAVVYMVLWANWTWEKICRIEPSGIWASRVINDLAVVPVESHRLYMYSREDEIIWWEDLVQAADEAKALGYRAELRVFEGLPHVGHMRLHPEQYWKAVFERLGGRSFEAER